MDQIPQIAGNIGFEHRYIPGKANGYSLLLLHGTGGNENSLIDLGAELLPGAAILSPRGKVLENSMPRFFKRLAEGVFDEQDLHQRTDELAQFVRNAAAAYSLDAGKVIAVGYSNGANIAASMLFSHSGLLCAAVLLRAMVPFEPSGRPQLPGTPVLLLSGDRDPLIPIAGSNRLATLLRTAGAAVTHQTVHAGHALTEPEFKSIEEFLADVSKK